MDKVSFENKYEEKLVGIISKNNDSDIMFVFCHGFLSGKESSTLSYVLDSLNEKNLNTFIFDFSGNGESEGVVGDASYLKEREDIDSVLNYLESQGYKRFCLVGHSMGGSLSIMTAATDSRVKWVVDIAGPAYPEKIKERRFGDDKVKEALETGSTSYDSDDGTTVIFNKKFFVDLDEVDIREDIKKVHVPILIVHGSEDEAVDIAEAEELMSLANEPKTFQIIKGADHRYKAPNTSDYLASAVRNWVLKWVKD